ncbi:MULTISPECIES: cell division protein FtsL [Brevundimonas]|uniref:cell division protein FtsL n=1 Tax=Brevundimonas TaxID=41275 RepID=UPI000F032D73|nr:cell division protein [Brevundimonas lutea]
MTALKRLFDWKLRGVRVVEIFGAVIACALIFSVYVTKAAADRENRQIASLEAEIADDAERVRLLRAEIARLERPDRLESLSRQAGLQPVNVEQRASVGQIETLAPANEPAPSPAAVDAAATPAATAATAAARAVTEARP